MARPDPETLFARYACDGDVGALAAVFDGLAPELLRLARRLGGDDRAEDLVQETFLTALERPETFERGARLEPWLVGILVNRARSQRRKDQRRPEAERLIERSSPPPDLELDRAERRDAVAAAVRELPPQMRSVVEAKLAGRDAGQTARELGISPGAARVRLHRALRRMRMLLPPSLATPFALLLLHSTGLGAVRTRVLRHAQHLGAGKGLGLLPGLAIGATWMTKKMLVAAAVVALGLSWLAMRTAAAPAAASEVQHAAATPRLEAQSGGGRTVPPEAEGRALATTPARRVAAPASEAASSLVGRAVDVEGRPVGGAAIEAWLGKNARTRYEREEPDRRLAADADGVFELGDLMGQFVVIARTEALTSAEGLTGELEPGADVRAPDLRLVPAQRIEAVVLDPELQPAAGAEVWLGERFSTTSETSSRGLWTFRAGRGLVHTGERGAFELTGLPEADPRVYVKLEPYLIHRDRVDRSASPPRVVLDRGLSLQGVVLDALGKPAAGARVRRHPHWSNVHTVPPTVVTDADGRFLMPAMVRRDDIDSALSVVHPGHAVAVVQPVRPGRDGGEPVVVRLETERVLAGRVVTPDGAPAAGVRVRVEGGREFAPPASMGRRPTWEWCEDLDEQLTDDEGRFRFEQLYPGPFAVEVGHGGSEEYARTEVQAGREDLELVLGRAPDRVTLTGRVVDAATGEPVTAFEVAPLIDGTATHRAFEDPEGRFVVRGLPPGRIDVRILAPGYARRHVAAQEFRAGEHELNVSLAPWRSVTLSVVDQAGEPLSGRVRVFDSHGEPFGLVTRSLGSTATSTQRSFANGSVTLRELPAEAITLELIVHEHRTKRVALDLTDPLDGPLQVALTSEVLTELHLLIIGAGTAPDRAAFAENWQRAAREGAWPKGAPAPAPEELLCESVELLFRDDRDRPLAHAVVRPKEGMYELGWSRVQDGASTRTEGSTQLDPVLHLYLPTGVVRVLRSTDGEPQLVRELELTAAGGEAWESIVLR